MINIVNKENCCGCGACEQRCPKQCISMVEDKEGFLYPRIDLSACVDCGLCEKVCPVINQGATKEPLNVYAAMNKDEEVRLKSSSGGIFTLLAEKIIQNGGVVFGAIFNNEWNVVHSYTETIDGLEALRESKYVQSYIGETYKNVKEFLDENRAVLFVGTSCQVKGLRLFLGKDYEKLISIDILCHGVPSPKVWRKYLDEIIHTKCTENINSTQISLNEISDISFRDKTTGWKNYSFKVWRKPVSDINHNLSLEFSNEQRDSRNVVFNELLRENIYMRGFLNDLYLRPSCYKCPSKLGKSGSDITIADYWNIGVVAPEFDDDKGTGLVLINTKKGNSVYPKELTNYLETGYKECQGRNGGFKTSLPNHPNREMFFEGIDSCKELSSHIISSLYYPKRSLVQRVKSKTKSVIKRLFQ